MQRPIREATSTSSDHYRLSSLLVALLLMNTAYLTHAQGFILTPMQCDMLLWRMVDEIIILSVYDVFYDWYLILLTISSLHIVCNGQACTVCACNPDPACANQGLLNIPCNIPGTAVTMFDVFVVISIRTYIGPAQYITSTPEICGAIWSRRYHSMPFRDCQW